MNLLLHLKFPLPRLVNGAYNFEVNQTFLFRSQVNLSLETLARLYYNHVLCLFNYTLFIKIYVLSFKERKFKNTVLENDRLEPLYKICVNKDSRREKQMSRSESYTRHVCIIIINSLKQNATRDVNEDWTRDHTPV